MHFGIVVFPGTWSDGDCYNALHDQLGQRCTMLWHKDTDLRGVDCVVLPGGFSYGDYLRCGAIARFSPVMQAVADHAARGGPVIGICNGFQILCEAGLVPGILLPNRDLQFHCETVHLVAVNRTSPFTRQADGVLAVPISHGEGNYFAEPALLERLEANGQVAFRYCDASGAITDAANPNGSLNNIAGVLNERGNVLGMMPHPERACEDLLGSEDGAVIFQSLIEAGAAAVSR